MKSLKKLVFRVVLMVVVSVATLPADAGARFTRFDSPEPVIADPIAGPSTLSPMQALYVGLEVFHTMSLPIP